MIRVLVADDEQLMRAGLIELLGADPGISVVGQAATGHIAVELAEHRTPDVVLMDIRMPDGDGITATQRISTRRTRVLELTSARARRVCSEPDAGGHCRDGVVKKGE